MIYNAIKNNTIINVIVIINGNIIKIKWIENNIKYNVIYTNVIYKNINTFLKYVFIDFNNNFNIDIKRELIC